MTRSKTSDRAEQDRLREEMRAAGLSYAEIAGDFGRRYKLRPRAAWRVAYGWTLQQTADRINDLLREQGLDETGKASMTSGHLCEYEQWPGPAGPGGGRRAQGRKPTPLLLSILARLYDTTVASLLDYDDFRWMPEAERLFLGTAQVPEKNKDKDKDAERERGDGAAQDRQVHRGGSTPVRPQLPVAGSHELTPDDEDRLLFAARNPRRIDRKTVDSLAIMLDGQRHTEDAIGSESLIKPVRAQLAVIEDLVLETRGPVRLSLVHVAGQWAQFAGWLHMNAGRRAKAGALLDRALQWAVEAGEVNLISEVLSFQGYAARLAGQPGPVVGLSQAARRDRSAYPGQLAISTAQEAKGHAMMGESGEVDRLLGEADDLASVAREHPDDSPPWLYYHSPAFFELQRGDVYRYLGRDDAARNRQAIEALTAGMNGLDAEARSSEWAAVYTVRLAIAFVQAREPEQACAAVAGAIQTARDTNSSRLTDQLRRLHARLAASWPEVPAVTGLGDALR